jgi:hypothetical protein
MEQTEPPAQREHAGHRGKDAKLFRQPAVGGDHGSPEHDGDDAEKRTEFFLMMHGCLLRNERRQCIQPGDCPPVQL